MLFPQVSSPEHENSERKKEILLEIELNGKVRFDDILNQIYNKLGIMCNIVSAEIEFFGDQNFGSIQLLVEINNRQSEDLIIFLSERKLLNTFIDHRKKKAV